MRRGARRGWEGDRDLCLRQRAVLRVLWPRAPDGILEQVLLRPAAARPELHTTTAILTMTMLTSILGLLELQLAHAKDQPTDAADTEARFNRCASALQPQLDGLMRYCWQPTLDAAEALLRPAGAQHPTNHPANFSWDVVIAQLQAMHRIGTGRRPLFRFM